MDDRETVEARFLGRDSVVLTFCIYCICCTCCICDVVRMWFCVYIVCLHVVMQCYVPSGTDSVV